jgi:hypothetical protein
MLENINSQKELRKLNLNQQYPYPHVVLVKTIAKEISCEPDFKYLEKSDPDLFRMLWY